MIAKRQIGNTGVSVSVLGFGGAALGNLFAAVDESDAVGALETAYAGGVRYFDTAPMYGYGLSERRFGRFFAGRPRRSYAVSTKVGRVLEPLMPGESTTEGFFDTPPFKAKFDYSRDGVRKSFEASLERLRVDFVDIAFLHDIGRYTHGRAHAPVTRQGLDEALPALHELKRQGIVGAVGIGVNEIEVCLQALEYGDVDCFLLAGRYTLLEQAPLDELLPICVRRNVSIVVGGPFNSGLLAPRERPGATFDYKRAPKTVVASVRAIYDVCARHGVDVGAAALQFVLAHPAVASVIPGMRTPREVEQNLVRLRTPLPATLWQELKHEGLLDPRAPIPGGS